jgi:hypothetical protein
MQDKILVVHPDDRSTDFLRTIYSNLPNYTLVTGGVTQTELRDMIKSHSRVMMMGHGTPVGLMAVGAFLPDPSTPKIYSRVLDDFYYPSPSHIIDASMVDALNEKDNNIFIWCNADQFVNKHQLKGFYTGMFISEYSEARFCGVEAIKGEVEFNNNLFAKLVCEVVDKNAADIYQYIKTHFSIPRSQVIKYNWDRMYVNL